MTTRLTIVHTTTYRYDRPVPYALQQLRVRPRSDPSQEVVWWDVDVLGGTSQVRYHDHYANDVELVRLDPEVTETTVTARGEVATSDTAGVVSHHLGYTPLWLFLRPTPLTTPGPLIRELVAEVPGGGDVAQLHELSACVADAVTYEKGRSHVATTAEDVLDAGHGVCQDHAHVFLAAARLLGIPARYVSGFLLVDDQPLHEASHAWAEAWIDGLGWVGFDVSNRISPDDRYVRVARGLDYAEAAPVSGVRFGDGDEHLDVEVQVQVQQQ